MKKQLKQVVLVAAVVLPLAAVARSVPASSGRPEFWSDGGCFTLSYSSVVNTCASRKSWEIPLSVDSSSGKTVVVAAQGASTANNVGCAALGLNREFTAVWGGTRKWLTTFPAVQLLSLTDAYVPNTGYLFVNCLVDNGGRVISVDYNSGL
jgi:hypothetical protein